jgi:hypothetical protein
MNELIVEYLNNLSVSGFYLFTLAFIASIGFISAGIVSLGMKISNTIREKLR